MLLIDLTLALNILLLIILFITIIIKLLKIRFLNNYNFSLTASDSKTIWNYNFGRNKINFGIQLVSMRKIMKIN
jgi:hypothetical protein